MTHFKWFIPFLAQGVWFEPSFKVSDNALSDALPHKENHMKSWLFKTAIHEADKKKESYV